MTHSYHLNHHFDILGNCLVLQLDYPQKKTENKEKGPAVASVIKSSFNMLYLIISHLFNM